MMMAAKLSTATTAGDGPSRQRLLRHQIAAHGAVRAAARGPTFIYTDDSPAVAVCGQSTSVSPGRGPETEAGGIGDRS